MVVTKKQECVAWIVGACHGMEKSTFRSKQFQVEGKSFFFIPQKTALFSSDSVFAKGCQLGRRLLGEKKMTIILEPLDTRAGKAPKNGKNA